MGERAAAPVVHRLRCAGSEIDDRQATMAETDAARWVDPPAGAIGPTVGELAGLSLQFRPAYRAPVEPNDAGDSIHARLNR